MSTMKKGRVLPEFKTDAEAEDFVDKADLSEYDLSGFKRMSLETLMKEVQMNVRLPQPLYDAVREAASRQALEAAVGR
jgi:predicted DNA binding CopG/RHH family protein